MSGTGESGPRVVLVTAPDREQATRIARTLVEERLAACVNLVDGLTSVYRWEGEVRQEPEVLLVIKTRAQHLEAIERRLAEVHPYEVPECVALSPTRVEARYLDWLMDETA